MQTGRIVFVSGVVLVLGGAGLGPALEEADARVETPSPLLPEALWRLPFFALHNEHLILGHKSGGGEGRGREDTGLSQGDASALDESCPCLCSPSQ